MPRVLLVALAVLLIPSSSFAPTQRISALAPWEVVVDGFEDLRGIAVDPDDVLFVADHHAGTVTRIAPDHSPLIIAKRLKRPIGLAFDATGRLLVAEEKAGRVVRLEANGTRTPIVSGVKQPRWLAVGDDGTVFISARRLARHADLEAEDDDEAKDDDADPQVILALTPGGRLIVFTDGLRQVQGLAVGEAVLYAATRGRRPGAHGEGVVFQIPILADGSAGPLTPLGPTGSFKHPISLARDPLGALYLTARDLDRLKDPKLKGPQKQAIAKLHQDGMVTLFATRLEHPQGLAFDADGNLYVADGRRVLRFRAPPAPSFTGLAPFTNQSPLAVTGTAEPSARVDLFVNESVTPITTMATGGILSLDVPLAANASNELEAFATGLGGWGLTGAAATATILHDGIAPGVVFLLPGAGGHVRQTVNVQARAADGGSGVATLTLTAGAHQLGAALSPVPTAPSVTATASWQTSTLTDGAYTLTASATDRAGNANVINRVVTVDNTPPDTTITGGPTGVINVADVTFIFMGVDILTPAANLAFAWRLDYGAWSAFSTASTATFSNLPPGPHVFEVKARDLAGNEDPSPASRSFTVGGLRVTITEPSDGGTVPTGLQLVRGTVETGGMEVGVTVNGLPAATLGNAFAAAVPVTSGTSEVTALATTAAGASAQHTIRIMGQPAVTPFLRATPQAGVAPLTVAFFLEGGGVVASVEVDFDGDGAVDFSGTSLEGVTFTFVQPGLYFPVATVSDAQGRRDRIASIVQVYDLATLDAALQAKWAAMKDALRVGDIPRALTYIAARARPRYETLFRVLAPRLGSIDSILTGLRLDEVDEGEAFYDMVRTDGSVTKSFEIRFVIDEDGIWRLRMF